MYLENIIRGNKMKKMYTIKGTSRIGDKVRLFLAMEEAVQEKPGLTSMLGNPSGLMEKMKQDAILQQQPDTITIDLEEWEKHQYKINDIVWITVEPTE